jgi:hypothetical protein
MLTFFLLQSKAKHLVPLGYFQRMGSRHRLYITSHGIPESCLQPSLSDKIPCTIEYQLPFSASQLSVAVTLSKYVKDLLKKGITWVLKQFTIVQTAVYLDLKTRQRASVKWATKKWISRYCT